MKILIAGICDNIEERDILCNQDDLIDKLDRQCIKNIFILFNLKCLLRNFISVVKSNLNKEFRIGELKKRKR